MRGKGWSFAKYRGWTISFWAKPIPCRKWDYEAYQESYDVDGDIIMGSSESEVKTLIDEWYEEQLDIVD